jgi:hypothetical protein
VQARQRELAAQAAETCRKRRGRSARLSIRRSVRGAARVYRVQARVLLPAALILYTPLGLLDAAADYFDHVEIEHSDVFTSLLVFGTLAQFAAAALGDVFYSGIAAAAVFEARGRSRHSVWELAKTLPYGRLIVVDLIVTLGTTIGLGLLIVPGIVFFTWFALAAPVIKIERLRVVPALGRSRALVRGSFWQVLLLLGTLYVVSNLLTSVAQDIGISLTGRKFLGEWVAAIAMGVAVEPIVAVTAVVLALELIELHQHRANAVSGVG